jgi:valyl-tRNA synthetase
LTQSLSTRFEPASIETRLYAEWSERGYFHVPPERVLEEGREPYVIVIPPPNVTAVLHMGHGLNNTIQDVLIRWRRMQGRASEWVPGTDHAGIATQNVVERMIAKEGLTKEELGREAFVERVWAFVRETGGTILEQLQAIGCSCDWERTRFTLDPGLSRAVREVFVRLYEKGLIYRGEYIINWCPRCQTALSNEEAEPTETEGRLYHLRYPFAESARGAAERARAAGADAIGQLEDGRWYLTVSTTRPETMLGDTGVAVGPDDERYRGLVGAEVELPLTGRTIPVVADAWVDPAFGSGMVKVTPAHDPNDFEIAARAGLPLLDVMTPTATMNERVPEAFRGLDRFEARRAVLAALEREGLLGGETPHAYAVPHCYRCDTVVEPRLSLQWFVRMKPLAEPALAASRDGTITFTPDRHRKVYEHWMENIRDWCISRQLWWGHRIPVWYCRSCGEMTVGREDPTACRSCASAELEQDPDVLDTWFSSWLWPFSVFGWPEENEDLRAFYPGHTLSTAPEILFFWVARMIMAGYEFMGRAPFTQVYLHATVRDKYGRKMSKSLGNGIDPLVVVERYGADALRWTVLSAAAVGTDINLDHEDLDAAFAPGRNVANKIWNAGRFTLMSVGEGPVLELAAVKGDLELADHWILSRLQNAVDDVSRGLERFRLHEVAEDLRAFFWGDLADWYLELVKTRLWGDEGEASRQAARATLIHVLDGVLRLLHPLVPFVSSALWEQLPWPEGARARPEALMIAPWPEAEPRLRDEEAERRMRALQELITSVRSLRKEYGVPEGEEVEISLATEDAGFQQTVGLEGTALSRLARVRAVHHGRAVDGAIGAHAVLTNGAELFLPLEGVIDLDRERERLSQEIGRLEAQVRASEGKLSNEQFVERAPADVVEREREKVRAQQEQLDKLREKLALFQGSG